MKHEHPPFSVLMSTYINDNPFHLRQAFESILNNSIRPVSIVVVEDGPISEESQKIILEFKSILNIESVNIPNNVGLGQSLAFGIKFCKTELIARFDSDDICNSNRFECQLNYLKNNPKVDIISCWIEEFDTNPDLPTSIRKVPELHKDILSFAKRRSPFNHMGVMYKKSKVIASGNYQHDYLYEDYALWVRMLHSGCISANVPEVLIKARVGNGMFERRGGWKYATSELVAQNNFRKIGFINWLEFIRNIAIRIPARIVPPAVRKYIYEHQLRK
ncbi:glycosyltransferase [Craterilacuibacter sinensis]|uniref:Glycosyltransferase n=1 Tax=Craterilacuibacter sinensis TaxID=2686017 RepID=A0A845BN17_9NEIS|nr:glycosyltransferase [Craterilacuibacter sinensis]MXR37659.1 glycosyltransferase [Craterilacuibacter sinensis]